MTDIVEATVIEATVVSPTIVDSRLFTEHAIEIAIATALNGRRNLKNSDLSQFYTPVLTPSAEAADKYSADKEKRRALGLPAVTAQEFLSQLSSVDTDLFLDILVAAGLELEFEEDMKSDVELGTAVTKIGAITPENVRIRLQHRKSGQSNHLHLLEKDAPVLADTDLDIQNRVNRIKQYLREYLA